MIPVSSHGEFTPTEFAPTINFLFRVRAQLFKATSSPMTQWIKEQGIISICDSIQLGENLIKLNQCRGKLAMGRNWQLPLHIFCHPNP